MAALILLVVLGLTVGLVWMGPLTALFSSTAGLHPLRWSLLLVVLWLLAGQGRRQV
jgi:hypothetical protein